MDFDRIMASAPVDAKAARQMGHGETWTPAKRLDGYFEDMPALQKLDAGTVENPEFVNFTGRKFGQLTVLGLMVKERQGASRGAGSSWVARCACGGFCLRSSKALKHALRGSNSFQGHCERCQYIRALRDGLLPGMRNYKGPS